MKKNDLHNHTTFSDGSLEPEELVRRRKEEGFDVISITDHDGIEGSKLCFEQKLDEKYGIEIIPGIEFDSINEYGKDMHILGYDMDFDSPVLTEALASVERWRDERNEKLMQAILDDGYHLTWDEVNAINGGRYVGKPTFAKALANSGQIPNVAYAFDVIFKKPEFKKTKKQTLNSDEVIKVIHAAGGKAVMAHPMEQMKPREGEVFETFKPRLIKILDLMIEYGIDGIECCHPSSCEWQSEWLEAYADAHGLEKTMGSDFHSDGDFRDYGIYHR